METTVTIQSDYETTHGKPMPTTNHAFAQLQLIKVFLPYEKQFTIFPELSLEINGKHVVPDLSIYPKMEIDWRHDVTRRKDPPLLAIEILSPSQGMEELMEKARAYFEAGVAACWIVQPYLKTIAVLTPDETKVYSEGTIVDAGTGIQIQVNQVFDS